MRLALAGDLVLTRAPRPTAGFDEVAALLTSADVAVANLDLVFRAPGTAAAVAGGGLWMGADPHLAGELARLGLTAVSRANNHAGDYGTAAMATTGEALDAAGIAHAGCGPDLRAARAPVFVESAAGVVALVSCAMTNPLHAMAGDGNEAVPGRPGISMVRVLRTHELAPAQFDQLARIAGELGLGGASVGAFQPAEVLARDGRPLAELRPAAGEQALVFLGDRFMRAERTRTVTRLNETDAEEVLAAVAQAASRADAVVLALHAHRSEPPPGPTAAPSPRSAAPGPSAAPGAAAAPGPDAALGPVGQPIPEVAELARRAVRAGATVVAVHGDHAVGGIETVDGGVILHGLGNLVFQPETVAALPAEAYAQHGLPAHATPADLFRVRYRGGAAGFPARAAAWRGLVAVAEVERGVVAGLTVHPVELGFGAPVQQRGDPSLATGPEAAAILAEVERASAAFGTRLDRVGTALRARLPREGFGRPPAAR